MSGYLLLILAEVVFNFLLGRQLAPAGPLSPRSRLLLTVFGVGTMLVVLGYFKDTHFLILDIIRRSGGPAWYAAAAHRPAARHLVLHLHADRLPRRRLPRLTARYAIPLDYALFVTFFPHLIAGPILHHQRDDAAVRAIAGVARLRAPNLAVGLSFFAIGLFKKTRARRRRSAPSRRRCSTPREPGRLVRHGPGAAALAYTFQLYFDFSGYSDMAIGLSLLFGVQPAGQFRLALQGDEHHRVLAALAHDAVALPARLPLHPARRQPPRPACAATQSDRSRCCSAASGTAPAGPSCSGAGCTASIC